MLCTLTKEVVADEDYLYEVKWDGYRIISYIEGKKVRMDSRSALDYTHKYPPVAKALKELGYDAVLDGEVVVFNEDGKPDFDALQTYNGHHTPINYCVFDILWLDGYDLQDLPLTDRKAILEELTKDNEVLRFSASFEDGEALYQQALDLDLEGIVAKRKDSSYIPNSRDHNWLKTPTRKRQEFVIGGWAESDKSRSSVPCFSALIIIKVNLNGSAARVAVTRKKICPASSASFKNWRQTNRPSSIKYWTPKAQRSTIPNRNWSPTSSLPPGRRPAGYASPLLSSAFARIKKLNRSCGKYRSATRGSRHH
jgi:hypothetical protein